MFPFRFSLLGAFIALTVIAFGIATLAFSGGYLIYPPLLAISILAIVTVREALNRFTGHTRSSVHRHFKLAFCTALLTASAALSFPLFGYATKWFANKRAIQIHRNWILEIDDPESVRLAGRQLHARLLALPKDQRAVHAADLPPELARLNPAWISASDTGLGMLLYRNYEKSFGLYIFPEHSEQQTGDVWIIDGLWLWETK